MQHRRKQMVYAVGVEDIEPDHWVAWAFAHPGLTGRGSTPDEAVASLQTVFRDGEIQVTEQFRAYPSEDDPDYLVNAFFEDDRRPLADDEVRTALDELERSRQELLLLVSRVPLDVLAQPIPGEVFGSVQGILWHVARAEWWYCDRLNAAPAWTAFPDELFAALAASRDNTRAWLPKLVGDERLATVQGETWSARKVLRRTLWHERDHTQHITTRLSELGWYPLTF
jgi:uncharacterized damage-inducible protein DinB